MDKCLNFRTTGCTNSAFDKDGSKWIKCLPCLKEAYIPKSYNENFWYKSSRCWRDKFDKLNAHHKKIMRRYSIRMQRMKGDER